MISITDKADKMLRAQGAGNDKFLRVIVRSGGCAGMTYDAEIDSEMLSDEKVLERHNGIDIVSNIESIPYLLGLIIDYSDDLITAGFRFNNESNESSCGCGASFGVAGFPELDKGVMSCGT
jgi:iron-sulfur cluster assembly protein